MIGGGGEHSGKPSGQPLPPPASFTASLSYLLKRERVCGGGTSVGRRRDRQLLAATVRLVNDLLHDKFFFRQTSAYCLFKSMSLVVLKRERERVGGLGGGGRVAPAWAGGAIRNSWHQQFVLSTTSCMPKKIKKKYVR